MYLGEGEEVDLQRPRQASTVEEATLASSARSEPATDESARPHEQHDFKSKNAATSFGDTQYPGFIRFLIFPPFCDASTLWPFPPFAPDLEDRPSDRTITRTPFVSSYSYGTSRSSQRSPSYEAATLNMAAVTYACWKPLARSINCVTLAATLCETLLSRAAVTLGEMTA